MFWPFTVRTNYSSDLKIFANSRPSASNFKKTSRSLEQFLLTVDQNNLGNKILWPHCVVLASMSLNQIQNFFTSKLSCRLPPRISNVSFFLNSRSSATSIITKSNLQNYSNYIVHKKNYHCLLSKTWIWLKITKIKMRFSNFSCRSLKPNYFSNLDYICSNISDLRNFQEKTLCFKNWSDLSLF